MSLPLEQEMAIHFAYLEHRAAVAEGFAKLRAKLLPPQIVGCLGDIGSQAWIQEQMALMAQGQMIPYLANPFQAAAMANPMQGLHRPLGGAWPWG